MRAAAAAAARGNMAASADDIEAFTYLTTGRVLADGIDDEEEGHDTRDALRRAGYTPVHSQLPPAPLSAL
jgi:hypothetical protein